MSKFIGILAIFICPSSTGECSIYLVYDYTFYMNSEPSNVRIKNEFVLIAEFCHKVHNWLTKNKSTDERSFIQRQQWMIISCLILLNNLFSFANVVCCQWRINDFWEVLFRDRIWKNKKCAIKFCDSGKDPKVSNNPLSNRQKTIFKLDVEHQAIIDLNFFESPCDSNFYSTLLTKIVFAIKSWTI